VEQTCAFAQGLLLVLPRRVILLSRDAVWAVESLRPWLALTLPARAEHKEVGRSVALRCLEFPCSVQTST